MSYGYAPAAYKEPSFEPTERVTPYGPAGEGTDAPATTTGMAPLLAMSPPSGDPPAIDRCREGPGGAPSQHPLIPVT